MLAFGPIAGLPLASGPSLGQIISISGDINVQFIPSSVLKGFGNTALTSTLIISPTGLIKGFGNTALTSTLTISPNGSAAGSGNLSQTISTIVILPSGLVTGYGNVGLGSSFLNISSTSLVKGLGKLTQTISNVSFTSNGYIQATANVGMNSSLTFTLSVNASGLVNGLGGISFIELLSLASINGIIGRLASSQFSLINSGNIIGIGEASSSILGFEILPSGGLVGSGILSSEDIFSIISNSSSMSAHGALLGGVGNALILDGNGLLGGNASSNGIINISLLLNGSIQSVASIIGGLSFDLLTKADISFFNAIFGNTILNLEYGNSELVGSGNINGNSFNELILDALLKGTASTNAISNINFIVNNTRLFSNVFGNSNIISDIFVPHLTATGILNGSENMILSATANRLNSIMFGNTYLIIDLNSIINGALPFVGRGDIIFGLSGLFKGKANANSNTSKIILDSFGNDLRGTASTLGNSNLILNLPNAPILYLRNGVSTSSIKLDVNALNLIANGRLKAEGDLIFNLASIPNAALAISGDTYIHFIDNGKLHNYNITNAIKNSKISLMSVINYNPVIEKISDNWYIVKLVKTTGRL